MSKQDLRLLNIDSENGVRLVLATTGGTIRYVDLSRREALNLVTSVAKALLRMETE